MLYESISLSYLKEKILNKDPNCEGVYYHMNLTQFNIASPLAPSQPAF